MAFADVLQLNTKAEKGLEQKPSTWRCLCRPPIGYPVKRHIVRFFAVATWIPRQ
jgi:hypothetical protein